MLSRGNKGFTLIETMGAISILLVGIVGSYAVVRQSLLSSNFSRSRLIASYLAQEGIEIVRNIRDTNWLQGGTHYDNGLSDGVYEAAYNDSSLTTSSDSGLDFLRLDGDFYDYNEAGTPTIFKRKISLIHADNSVDSKQHLEVTVTVYWRGSGDKEHEVSVQDNLYDWY